MPTAQAASKVLTELLLSALAEAQLVQNYWTGTHRGGGLGNLYVKGQRETAARVPISHYKQRLSFIACLTVLDVDYKYHSLSQCISMPI